MKKARSVHDLTEAEMSSYILAVDSAAQGTKAALYDKDLQQIAAEFEEANLISPEPGCVSQETEDVMGAVRRTIQRVLSDSNAKGSDIAAILVSGQMGGVIGVASDGTAVTPYDSWYDTRCGQYADEMREKAGKRITEITGSPVLYTHGPKILWWKNERPDEYAKIAKFVTLHTYINMQMCGLKADDAYLDYTCIQYTGFGDNLKKEWSDELLDMFGVSKDKLPRILAPADTVGKVTGEFAASCGLAEGTPVLAGMGGAAATLFGSGMTTPGKIRDFAGTANVLAGVLKEYKPDTCCEMFIQMRSPIDGTWFPLVYIAGGALALRWYMETFTGTPDSGYEELEKEAADVPAGCDGVMFFPIFSGLDLAHGQDIKACFTGLNWSDSRAHLYRAVMEGAAYEYGRDICMMKHAYPELDYTALESAEGAAQSNLYNQIKADVLGMTVETNALSDRALRGDAAIAVCAAGMADDPAALVAAAEPKPISTFAPNEKNRETYGECCKAFCHMLDALKTVYRAQAVAAQPAQP